MILLLYQVLIWELEIFFQQLVEYKNQIHFFRVKVLPIKLHPNQVIIIGVMMALLLYLTDWNANYIVTSLYNKCVYIVPYVGLNHI